MTASAKRAVVLSFAPRAPTLRAPSSPLPAMDAGERLLDAADHRHPCRQFVVTALIFAAGLAATPHAFAQDDTPAQSVPAAESLNAPAVDDVALPADSAPGSPLLMIDWSGLLRLRGQWIEGGTLGNGVSGLPSPLSLNDVKDSVNGAGDRLAQLDLRLRLSPALVLGSYARIDSLVDVAGRTVMGSDLRTDTTDGRMLGFEGNGPVRDAMAVRRMWATFDVFGLATFEVGRMGDHFGLGILRNDGRDGRADWQSDVDRLRVAVELFGLQLRVMRDNRASLPMLSKGPGAQDPIYPVADSTDVVRWTAEVEQVKPADAPGLRWAFAIGYQDQAVGLALVHGEDPAGKLSSDCIARGTCVQLVTRDAVLVQPQAFVSWRAHRPWGGISLAAEGALSVGTIGNSDALASTDTSKTIIAGAAAGRGDLWWGRQRLSLDAGYASGEGEGGFGVLDRQNLTATTPAGEVHRSFLTGLPMHRGYLVDGLLYREVIGAVANSAFVRPAWRFSVIEGHRDGGLTLEFGAVLAMAARIGATPGKGRWIGVEPEARVDWRLSRWSQAILQASVLMPGDALAAGRNGAAAETAVRVSLDWIARF